MDKELNELNETIIEFLKKIIGVQDKYIIFLLEHLIERQTVIDKIIAYEDSFVEDFPEQMAAIAKRLGLDSTGGGLYGEICNTLLFSQKEFSVKYNKDMNRAALAEFGKERAEWFSDVEAYRFIADAIKTVTPHLVDQVKFIDEHHNDDTLKSSISRGRKKIKKVEEFLEKGSAGIEKLRK